VSIGTSVAACGNVCFLNSTSKIATVWFGENQRALATALGSLANPLGSIIGFILPSLFLSESDEQDIVVAQAKFGRYLVAQNSLATIAGLFLILIVKEKPPTPPSKAATTPAPDVSFLYELRGLLNNRSYVFLVLSYGSLYGTVLAIGAIISSLTEQYSYSGKDNSIFGGVFIGSGMIGSLAVGILLDKFRKYKLSVVIIAVMSFVLISTTYYSLPSGKTVLFALNIASYGLFAVPFVPLSFAFSVELTYPQPEAVSNGMMIMTAKFYGTAITVGGGIMAAKLGPLYAITLFSVNNLIALVISFFIKEELRRLRSSA